MKEIICKKCHHYVFKEFGQPSFNSHGQYRNVWHMWCKKFGDLEEAIETGKCNLHSNEKYHRRSHPELEIFVAEPLDAYEQTSLHTFTQERKGN